MTIPSVNARPLILTVIVKARSRASMKVRSMHSLFLHRLEHVCVCGKQSLGLGKKNKSLTTPLPGFFSYKKIKNI